MKVRSFLVVILTISTFSLSAQVSKFGKPAVFNDRHTLYEYKKSNWDGTHSSTVFLYVADSNRLESFKWWEGDIVATLVSAVINWRNYSVSEFQNHKYHKPPGMGTL